MSQPNPWDMIANNIYEEANNLVIKLYNSTERRCPLKNEIFQSLFVCPFNKLKVIIIGMDPYYTYENGLPIANGIAFSIREGSKIPPTLRNIYSELQRNYHDFNKPNHGNLIPWSSQGVLLLNKCLTAVEGKSGVDDDIWDNIIIKLLEYIQQYHKNIIFCLWGSKAQKLKKYIKFYSLILESSHPSPMSYDKGSNPFRGCNHFKKINDQLKILGNTQINWNL